MHFSPSWSNEHRGSSSWDLWPTVLEMDCGTMFWWTGRLTAGGLASATLSRSPWLTHPVRFEGSKCVLSQHKYSLVYFIIFPWPAPTVPTRQELSGCLKSWGLSLIKGHCLYRMSLMFFWQELDIVTISCLLSMRSAVAVRLSDTA